MLLDEIKGSRSLEILNSVLERQERGEKIVSLAIGDPSFKTPVAIIDAAHKAMLEGDVHYVSSYGTLRIREAIKRKVARKNRIGAELQNTIFLTARLAVYASFLAASNGGFEVLVPDPGYFYDEPVRLAGGTPVRYRLGDDFALDLDEVKKKLTSRTSAILINSPSNPTGSVFDRDQLEQLHDFCRRRKIFIISDEAYEDLVYEKEHVSVGSFEDTPETVISLFSLSKSYSMTGWRAGYLVASEKVIHAIDRLLEYTMTCYPPFIQEAAAYALDEGDRFVQQFRRAYAERRALVQEKMQEIDALVPNKIEGAFYAFPGYRGRIKSLALSKSVLEEQKVAVLPGSSFGDAGEGHFRISYAGELATVAEGMDRLKRFFRSRKSVRW